jgi:hypothetical protein
MTRKTRERIESLENRLSAFEDSLESAEIQIKQRKAENVYLNRLLDMLQHGIVQKGGQVPNVSPAPESAEGAGNSWSE